MADVFTPTPGGKRLSTPSSTCTWRRSARAEGKALRLAERTSPSSAEVNHSYSKRRPARSWSWRKRMRVPDRFFHTELGAAGPCSRGAKGSQTSNPSASAKRTQVRGPVCCPRRWILSTVSYGRKAPSALPRPALSDPAEETKAQRSLSPASVMKNGGRASALSMRYQVSLPSSTKPPWARPFAEGVLASRVVPARTGGFC